MVKTGQLHALTMEPSHSLPLQQLHTPQSHEFLIQSAWSTIQYFVPPVHNPTLSSDLRMQTARAYQPFEAPVMELDRTG